MAEVTDFDRAVATQALTQERLSVKHNLVWLSLLLAFTREQNRREGCRQGIEAAAKVAHGIECNCTEPVCSIGDVNAAIRALDPDAVLGGKHG